ncbi:probable trehalase isoform X2 [Rhodamnia argentea]|uniref:Trehalase n=1 Tax=Rhodamnia argentea TaxID=178133 RepID=A0A8B8Q1P8_9MYRT|nr:probable trehalase isoform X2 [Rhodamnia argentea]
MPDALCSLSLLLLLTTSFAFTTGCPSRTSAMPTVASTPLLTFLERLQEAALASFGPRNFDPKLYVDLSLKSDIETVERAFADLPKSSNGSVLAGDLEKFIAVHFGGAGDDLVSVQPADFVPEPEGFLPRVKNPAVRAWALQVHALWRNLSRRVDDAVRERPDWHTLLPLPGPVIIPGSRFREVYYWDSYWVIRGLLASKMYATAKAIVTNLVYLLEQYGHVLNGARVYYTNRSQPPLLSAMIRAIYERTHDVEFVMKCLPALLKEHEFWTSGLHQITIQDRQCSHNLSRYYAMWDKPRPESFTIDKESASNISGTSEKQKFYREVASTAESGWDFSTRWMRNPEDFTTLATTSIIPVDLNIYILRMELDISFFGKVAGNHNIAKHFLEASKAREKAVSTIFWNERMGQWHDYWLGNSSSCMEGQHWDAAKQNQNVFASNFIPLWIDVFNSDKNLVDKVAKSLRSSGLLHPAGIATSLTNSSQQWDFPNGWAPLQHMIAEGLARSGSSEARSLAEDIFIRWIRTNYVGYKKTGTMHEKYDVEKCGEFGGGGEYVPQTGFGWSNGVVLAFLEEFGWPEDRKIDCQ